MVQKLSGIKHAFLNCNEYHRAYIVNWYSRKCIPHLYNINTQIEVLKIIKVKVQIFLPIGRTNKALTWVLTKLGRIFASFCFFSVFIRSERIFGKKRIQILS